MSNSNGGVYGMPGIPLDAISKMIGGTTTVAKDDPAFQPPTDATSDATRQKAGLVYRDLPVVTVQNTWSVDQARRALYSHMQGVFYDSGQLWDAIVADPRVRATLGSATTGLFGREIRYKAADDSDAAREVLDAWTTVFPRFAGDSALQLMHKTEIGMGFSAAQLVWDTTKPIWQPYARPWPVMFNYYNWPARCYVAQSQDGNIAVTPGDGKWMLHCANGEYRGWIYGAIRALAEPWLLRHFAARDMGRFSEIHGLPTRVGYVPAVSAPEERSAFEDSLENVGSNTSMIIPRGVDGQANNGYGYELVEATDRAWEAFPGLMDRCDLDIILAILFQNLTTEVKGGSFAATSAHMDIRQSGLQGYDEAWKNTIYRDVARPFAYLMFGDADLAPWTWRDVEPREDLEHNAKQFLQFGTAIEVLARGGVKFKDVEELRRFAAKNFGLEGLPDFDIGDPVSGGGLGMK